MTQPIFFTDDGGKSAKKAARSTIWAANAPKLEGITGRYYDTSINEQRLHPTAYDPKVQASILSLIEACEASD